MTSGASGARVPPHLEVKSPLPQLLSKAHRSGLAGRDLVMIVLTYVHTSRSKSCAQSHPFPAAPAARLSNTHDRTILLTSAERLVLGRDLLHARAQRRRAERGNAAVDEPLCRRRWRQRRGQ